MDETRQKYEQRIDELFAGDKASFHGVFLMEQSDLMHLLKYGDFPIRLDEGKVIINFKNHAEMTAEQWKKLPDWLDNPAVVLCSRTYQGRLVFVPDEMINNAPVFVIVEPNHKNLSVHLLVNAYARDREPQQQVANIKRDIENKNLEYIDTEKVRNLLGRSGLQLSSVPSGLNANRKKIVTEKMLQGYRKSKEINLNQQIEQQKGNKMDEQQQQVTEQQRQPEKVSGSQNATITRQEFNKRFLAYTREVTILKDRMDKLAVERKTEEANRAFNDYVKFTKQNPLITTSDDILTAEEKELKYLIQDQQGDNYYRLSDTTKMLLAGREIELTEQVQQQIMQSENQEKTYSKDNPYAAYAKDDDEVRQNADDWEAREPLTAEKLAYFNAIAQEQGFTTHIENHHADMGVFQAEKQIDETYRIEILGQFKNQGALDIYELPRDFTMDFHQGDEIVHIAYGNNLDTLLEQASAFAKNPAQWIKEQDKTVEQHLSEMVDEVVEIAQRQNVEQDRLLENSIRHSEPLGEESQSQEKDDDYSRGGSDGSAAPTAVAPLGNDLTEKVKEIHHQIEVESLEFQFTHKGLADRSAAFNQELLQLNPEQLKELQPFFEQHKAIQTLQGLYEQTNDTARLEEINEHNRLIEWKIHNKVEAYLGKHIDYSDMDYHKGIKTGEELRQMMNEKQPETAVGSSQNNTVQDSSLATQGVNDESISGSPKQSQSQIDEPKNFVQNFVKNHQNAQNQPKIETIAKNSAEILSDSNISHPETFQKQVMFAKVEESEVSKMIDDLAKERTYLAVDIEHKDTAKAAGAKWDKVLKGWYAERGNLNNELQAFLPQQPEITVQNRKPYSDFMYQAQKVGVDLNESNFQEKFNEWVRCPVKGKGKSNRDGGYKLFRNDDGSIGATAKNYSTGDSVGWCDRTQGEKKVKSKVPLADFVANKKQTEWQEMAKNTIDRQIQQMRSEVAEKAYHSLQSALPTDPYIQNKGINDIGKLKRLDDGSTIVPLYHNGKIANLQMIPSYDSSKKRLMTQAVKTGAYYSIGNGKNPQTVIIAEGMATADSVHQIASEIYGKENVLTLSAVDSGSLSAVANKVSLVYPDANKIIAADNDAHNATRSELKFKNAGKDKAEEVKQAFSDFQVALCPALTDDKGVVKNTDWNDFLKNQGKEMAVKQFSGCLNGVQYNPKQQNNEHDGRER